MDATTVAVDLAKDVFEVAFANRAHRIVDRRRLTWRQFESFIEGLSAETAVVMEACGTACAQQGGHRGGQQARPNHLGTLAPGDRLSFTDGPDARRVTETCSPNEMLSEDWQWFVAHG